MFTLPLNSPWTISSLSSFLDEVELSTSSGIETPPQISKLEDEVLFDSIYKNNEIKLQLKFKANGEYRLGFNDTLFKEAYKALPGRWIGGKIGIYAKGKVNGGYGLFKYFKVREAKRWKNKISLY